MMRPIALLCALIPLPLMAQDGTAPAPEMSTPPVMTTRLFDQVATYAPPPWIEGVDLSQLNVSRQQVTTANDTELFVFEIIPPGEAFDDWSALYALSAETPLDGTVEDYLGGQFSVYDAACESFGAQLIHDTPDWKIAALFCGAYKDRPDTGEVAIMSYVKPSDTLVKHYFHQRGRAFDIRDPDRFPLDVGRLQAMVDRLAELRLTPAPE